MKCIFHFIVMLFITPPSPPPLLLSIICYYYDAVVGLSLLKWLLLLRRRRRRQPYCPPLIGCLKRLRPKGTMGQEIRWHKMRLGWVRWVGLGCPSKVLGWAVQVFGLVCPIGFLSTTKWGKIKPNVQNGQRPSYSQAIFICKGCRTKCCHIFRTLLFSTFKPRSKNVWRRMNHIIVQNQSPWLSMPFINH